MKSAESRKMLCDRIEDGAFCVLIGQDGTVLSLPLDTLNLTPHEKEIYTVSTDARGAITLIAEPAETKKRLARINELRKRIIRLRKK